MRPEVRVAYFCSWSNFERYISGLLKEEIKIHVEGCCAVYVDCQNVGHSVMGLLEVVERDMGIALDDYCAVEHGIWLLADRIG